MEDSVIFHVIFLKLCDERKYYILTIYFYGEKKVLYFKKESIIKKVLYKESI